MDWFDVKSLGSDCSIAVEHTPHDEVVVGLNFERCWSFFLCLYLAVVSLTRFREDVQHLMIFPLAVQLGRTKITVPGISQKLFEVIVRGSF